MGGTHFKQPSIQRTMNTTKPTNTPSKQDDLQSVGEDVKGHPTAILTRPNPPEEEASAPFPEPRKNIIWGEEESDEEDLLVDSGSPSPSIEKAFKKVKADGNDKTINDWFIGNTRSRMPPPSNRGGGRSGRGGRRNDRSNHRGSHSNHRGRRGDDMRLVLDALNDIRATMSRLETRMVVMEATLLGHSRACRS